MFQPIYDNSIIFITTLFNIHNITLNVGCGLSSIQPVSYTHLDVYKRQIYTCVRARARACVYAIVVLIVDWV